MELWHLRSKDYRMFKSLYDLCNSELKANLAKNKAKKLDEHPTKKKVPQKKTKSMDELLIQEKEGELAHPKKNSMDE